MVGFEYGCVRSCGNGAAAVGGAAGTTIHAGRVRSLRPRGCSPWWAPMGWPAGATSRRLFHAAQQLVNPLERLAFTLVPKSPANIDRSIQRIPVLRMPKGDDVFDRNRP